MGLYWLNGGKSDHKPLNKFRYILEQNKYLIIPNNSIWSLSFFLWIQIVPDFKKDIHHVFRINK